MITNNDFTKMMNDEKMNEIEMKHMNEIDEVLNMTKMIEISENERDTLAFIRNNVIRDIESKNINIKQNIFKIPINVIMKIAATVLITLTGYFGYTTLKDDNTTNLVVLNDQLNLLSETKMVITNFTSFTNESPKFILDINIEKANDILNNMSKLKNENSSNKELLKFLSDMERILLAISSLDDDNAYLQIKLIQNGIKKKNVLNQLNDFKI